MKLLKIGVYAASTYDEPLKGERKGQGSVRMNKAYRLIYKVIKDRIHIELIEVNKHVY